MLGLAGSSYALFAAVWGVLCLVSGALVTDAMLRNVPPPLTTETERPEKFPSVED